MAYDQKRADALQKLREVTEERDRLAESSKREAVNSNASVIGGRVRIKKRFGTTAL